MIEPCSVGGSPRNAPSGVHVHCLVSPQACSKDIAVLACAVRSQVPDSAASQEATHLYVHIGCDM